MISKEFENDTVSTLMLLHSPESGEKYYFYPLFDKNQSLSGSFATGRIQAGAYTLKLVFKPQFYRVS